MMNVKLATAEYLDKCPCCHKDDLIDAYSDSTYGLAKVSKNGKLDDKDFIELSTKKCPNCGAIFFFEK